MLDLFADGFSVVAISRELGITPQQAARRLSAALAELPEQPVEELRAGLADTDLPGLRVGLDAADEAAVALGEEMTGMRLAAEKEAEARRTRGLAGPGPYEIAYQGARNVLAGCILIVEETELPEGHVARWGVSLSGAG